MQEIFRANPHLVATLKNSLSQSRFQRYIDENNGDEIEAIRLYQWNSMISQAIYIYLQCWEVCLRNKINDFLSWKYGASWPYDGVRAMRIMKADDRKRVSETIIRQERERSISGLPTSVIVADLSAGFWVSQLSAAYDVPHVWRYNLARIFPNEPRIDRTEAWTICDNLLVLRNRVAHHEPIYHMPLVDRHAELRRMVAAMCVGSAALADASCRFAEVFAMHPDSN